MNKERLETLLANAVEYIQELTGYFDTAELESILGLTETEYDELMNGVPKTYYFESHTFKIVEKVPARYGIWPIGKHMGSDKYIPFYEDYPINGPYAINPNTLLAVELPYEEVMLLRKTANYGNTIANLEKLLNEETYCFENYVSREEIKQAIKILKRITEDK